VDSREVAERLDALRKDKEAAESKLEEAAARLREAESVRAENDHLRNRLELAVKQRDDSIEVASGLEQRHDELEQLRGRLETELAGAHDELQRSTRQIDGLRAERTAWGAERDQLVTRAEQLKAEVSRAISAREELERRKDAEVTELKQERDALSSSLEALADEIDSVTAELASVRDESATARSQLEGERDALRSRLDEMHEEAELARANFEAERAQLLSSHEREREERAAAERLLQNAIEELRAEIAAARESAVELESRVAQLETELDEARAVEEERLQLIADLEADRDRALSELEIALADKEASNERLKQALAKLVVINDLTAERDELARRLRETQEGLSEIESLRQERAALQARVASLSERPAREPARARDALREPSADPVAGRPRAVVRLDPGDAGDEGSDRQAVAAWRAFLHRSQGPEGNSG
jgi:chromosome segregation ATPase